MKVSHLKKHIGFWMRLVSNSVSHSFARKIDGEGVTVAEWVILREMYEFDEAIAPSRLSEVTGLTRGAVSKLVDRLLAKKLLSRKESSDDRRFQEIQLTRAGRMIVPRLASLADENDEQFFSSLTVNERKYLTDILMRIASANKLNQMPTE